MLIYPTASTTAIFLNGIHVDEAYGFNYKENIPKVPIYGYNDYEFTKVARGKGIVQGVLLVNFVFPGYLSFVLNRRLDSYVPRLYNYNITTDSPSSSAQHGEDLSKRIATELPANSDPASRAARADYIASLLVTKGGEGNRERVKKALNGHFTEVENDSFNSTTIPNPLTMPSAATNGNQLDVYYMDPAYAAWFVRFNNVEFGEVSQQVSQAGSEGSSEPLYLIYQFIAKNVEIKQISS